jgi:Holliday junction DNA helicase RuvA
MIAWLRGRVAAVEAAGVVLDVSGVGYRVYVPAQLLASLSRDAPLELHTYLHVRDAEMTLYGAADRESMRLFETVLGVSGVGPRLAMALLSAMSTAEVLASIEAEDVDALTRVPGVGRKTALRMILDLRGKLPDLGGAASVPTTDEALLVLTGLGYTPAEARRALDGIDPHGVLEDRIRAALKQLSRD